MNLRSWLLVLPSWFLLLRASQAPAIEVRSPAEQERGNFGYRVLVISDLTGDGTPELAVTASHTADFRGPRGAVFVLNGRDFSQVSRTDPPYPDADRIADQGSFGWCLAEGTAVNGDGVRGLIIGAIYDDRPDLSDFGYGKAYVVNPLTGAIVQTFLAPRPQRGTFFGLSAASIPATAVGRTARYAISAPRGSAGGQVHLFDAANGALLFSFRAPNPRSDDWFGASLAAIGDVNGDGRADLAVGAGSENNENNSSIGAAYIISGETGHVLHQLIPPDVPADTRFRWAVAAVPDVNGDGKTDVLVGLALASPPGALLYPGRACLFSGADGTWLRTLASPEPQAYGFFGWSVAGLPDITGDGAGELLIGCAAHGAQGFSTYGEQRVYLLDGATGQLIQTFESPNGGEAFGLSVTGMLDRKGKLRTIVAGAPHEGPAPSPFRSGRVHAFPLTLSFVSGSRSAEGFRLSLSATDDNNYEIQASSDLKVWTNLTTLKPTNAPVFFVDKDAMRTPERFYRAQRVNPQP